MSQIAASIDGYFQRVETRLKALDPVQARAFLDAQVERWTGEFQTFMSAIDSGAPIPPRFAGADAFDFHDTLARLGALQQRQAVSA
jgi:hypothetical protein